MKIRYLFFLILPFSTLVATGQPGGSGRVYFTTGFKMGEVTDSSVVIWTRLCKTPKPVPVHHQRREAPYRSPVDFDNDMPVNRMDGAVEGSPGQVLIELSDEDTSFASGWMYVSSYRDYTIRQQFSGLNPNTVYAVAIRGRKDPRSPVTETDGSFRTAPSEDEITAVTFTSTSCQYFWDFDDPSRGFKVYDAMNKLDPLFHCQSGDYVYYDKGGPMAYTVEMARHKWHANNSWPSVRDFYIQVPIYLQKDDHDMLKNDATPYSTPFGELSFSDGLSIWHEQVPLTGLPYRTFRWGRDLQIWLSEGREFRSDNKMPDGAEKTIWGSTQKNWFMKTVKASDATFKILVSPTPVVGPDRSKGKNDNHSNEAFRTEGEWLRGFLAEHDVFVINGDRHWQYVSVDDETGTMEFSQGPSSDHHAAGWQQSDLRPEHKFLRVKGGFLAVRVERDDQPVISFIHYDVDGNVQHTETIRKTQLP